MEHKLIQTPNVKNRTAGVYQIRNTLDGKVYIGSSVNLDKRLPEHRRKLTSGRHSSPHLQSAWDKYGASNFVFEKLLVCSDKDILFYEQRMIDGYEAMNPERGYNKRLVAKSNAGMKHSEETKRRVSEGMKGRVFSDDTRAKISAAKLGRPHTALARARMSSANKGRKLSAAVRESRGKLTYAKVEEIRTLRASTGITQRKLAEMYGVSRESIGDLLRGNTWS